MHIQLDETSKRAKALCQQLGMEKILALAGIRR